MQRSEQILLALDKNLSKTQTETLGTMFELDLIFTFAMASFLKILKS